MSKPEFHRSGIAKLAGLFLVTFSIVFSLFWMTRSVASSSSSLPTSGSCAFLMTSAIPYGANIGGGGYQTGYNGIGLITFSSATSGTLSLRIINPTFHTNDSPFIDTNGGIVDLNNFQMTITPMTANTGFVGGYTFTFTGTRNGTPLSFEFTGVPSNSGKTIVFVSTTTGTALNPSTGPASGVCQV